jgi:uncharacterized repeat protein (TIGR01451 family)
MSLRTLVRSYWQHTLAVAMLVGALVVPVIQVAAANEGTCINDGNARDCNTNSIMYGGAYSKQEWLNYYKNGDSAGHKDLQQVYASSGITEQNFMDDTQTVEGRVYKNGDVKLADGTLVAVNSWSAGRHNVPGAVQDGTVYMTPESVQFLSDSIPAWINVAGGSFKYAIIKSCGNYVKSYEKPFGQIFKRVTNVTQEPANNYAADTTAYARPVNTGDTVKYTVRINNAGTADMTNVIYTDDLPAGIELVSDPSKRHIEHNLGTIAKGTGVEATITAKVTGTTGYIDNQACFKADHGQQGCDHAIVKVKDSTPTPTPTPSTSVTPSPTPSPSVTPTPTPTPTPSVTPTPTPTPSKTPTPTPTPSKTPTPTPTPSKTPTPTPTPTPKPGDFTCAGLTAAPKGGDLNSLTYVFTVKPVVTGNVKVTGYQFEIVAENGSKKPISSDTNAVEFTFAQAGTYTVHAQVKTSAGTTAIVELCSVKLTVGPTDKTPQPTPPGESLGTSTTLPETGPEAALGGAMGLGAIGFATRSYLRSRRSLLEALRRK